MKWITDKIGGMLYSIIFFMMSTENMGAVLLFTYLILSSSYIVLHTFKLGLT